MRTILHAGFFVSCMCAAQMVLAQDANVLAHGQALFEGSAGTGLSIKLGDRQAAARGISCAGCHGQDAGGGSEVQSGPAIDWASLSQKRGYTPETLADVLTNGQRPDGSVLGQSMPRFVFTDPEADVAALVAWLSVVAAMQRRGFESDRITLRRGSALRPFWQAFETSLQGMAPNGVFGRRILLVNGDDEPFFVTIGATTAETEARDGAPSLFPLHTMLGDEDPLATRGAFASIADQIIAVVGNGATPQVLAGAETMSRLRPLLSGKSGISFVMTPDLLDRAVPVFAVGPDMLGPVLANPPSAPLYALIDDLAQSGTNPSTCLTVTDPRPVADPDESTGAPLARYGHIAALVLVEALKRCGPDCTRSRLMRAFDRVQVTDPDWPPLDYAAHPLTGSRATILWHVCEGRARSLTEAMTD